MIYTYLNNKYFMSLDDYNKDLIAHKLNFFKDCQGFDFLSLLKSLSFNLDYYSKNYRWGKRYFNKESKKFTWLTSNSDKKFQKLQWNPIYHQYELKEYSAYFSKDMIQKHFLSPLLTKQRKISFYYNLDKKEKNELKNHNTSLVNMYMVDNKTFGSSQQIGTDILLIDIDNYEDMHALETLSMFLDKVNLNVSDLIFLEQNVFTGGIHTAIRLPHQITNTEFYPLLMQEMQKEGIRIECNFINTILRFPLSYEYVAIQKNDKIFKYDEFIPNQFWEKTFENYLNNLNDNICNSDYLNNLIMATHQLKDEDKWNNYWKIKRNLFKKSKKIKKKFENYDFYKLKNGQRYNSMSKIIPYAKITGHTLDETVDIIFENNINSKDLAKWSKEKLKKNITKFYNNCPDQVCSIIKSTNEFISNKDLVPEITKKFLFDVSFNNWFTGVVCKEYLKERNKHNNGFKQFSNEKFEILKKLMPYLLQEIIGKMFYDSKNKKEFINSKFNRNIGFQLSDSHFNKIQEYAIQQVGIDSPLAKTSSQYLKKAILKALKLAEIKYKNRSKNWMLGSCKEFKANTTFDIYNILNSLYNRCFKQLSIKSFLNKDDYKLIILYISLIENYDFLEYDNINYVIDKIPWYQP